MPEFPHRIPKELRSLSPAEFDALPFGVVELDAEGTVMRVNEPEARRTERSRADFVGRNFFEIAPCLALKRYDLMFRIGVAMGHLEETFEFTYPRTEQGFIRPERVMVTLLSRERGIGYVVATTEPLGS